MDWFKRKSTLVKIIMVGAVALMLVLACGPTPTPGVFEALPTYTSYPTYTPYTPYSTPLPTPGVFEVLPTYTSYPTYTPYTPYSTPSPTLTPRPTATPIPQAKPAFEVRKVRHAWSNVLGITCVHVAVEIKNKGNCAVKLRDIVLTIYDINGEVLDAIPALPVPRIIKPGEIAYANTEVPREDLEPGRVGEPKVNFDYDLTSEEPQLLTVENLSGGEGYLGYEVTGEVVNTSRESAGRIRVAVVLYGEGDNLLGVFYAYPQVTLAQGDRVGFRAMSFLGLPPEVGEQVKRLVGVAYNLKW